MFGGPPPHVVRILVGFNHSLACQLTGKQSWILSNGGGEYYSLGGDMGEAILEEVETYITWRHNTIVQYIATRKIMDMCEEAGQCMRAWVSNWWWEK